jgi:lipopolysaccharide transport system ATP-binding protein
MPIVIKAENLSKQYVIRHRAEARYNTLRDVIAERTKSFGRKLASPFSQTSRKPSPSRELFWALRDVNLEIQQGDRIGIIGRNGAGKTTLLKIFCRITEPTTGRISIKGRMSSLLEVGTGFHPELTGRENIFLNGAVLGMSTREIKRKFDEIVAFAEVEKFLDTPVKRYSSGMYVRLAFSVAAHLEPEILIVDEVLAVGDAQFQRKCMGRMKEVGSDGRTVLFVSHNMTSVTSLCTRCLLLERGKIVAMGDPNEITTLYFKSVSSGKGSYLNFEDSPHRPGDDFAKLCSARLIDSQHKTIEYAKIDQDIGVEMVYEILKDGYNPIPNIHIFTQGQYAFVSGEPKTRSNMPKGKFKSVMWIPGNFLNEGMYIVGIALSTMEPVKVHFFEQEALYFNVVDNLNNPRRNDYTLHTPGIVRPALDWSTEPVY